MTITYVVSIHGADGAQYECRTHEHAAAQAFLERYAHEGGVISVSVTTDNENALLLLALAKRHFDGYQSLG